MEQFRNRLVLAFGSTLVILALIGTSIFRNAASHPVDSSALEESMCCIYEVHSHDASCYSAEGELTCGYADWVIHTHNQDCYKKDGTLRCKLEEREAHVHKYSCYGTAATKSGISGNTASKPAVAVDPDTVKVVSSSAADASVTNKQIAELKQDILNNVNTILNAKNAKDKMKTDTSKVEQAKPTSNLRAKPIQELNAELNVKSVKTVKAASGNAVSTKPAVDKDSKPDGEKDSKPAVDKDTKPEADKNGGHVHTDKCYIRFKVLDCTKDQEDKNHVHTDRCYVMVEIPTCEASKPAAKPDDILDTNGGHKHTDDCYLSVRVLVCGKDKDKSHTHTDACYKTVRVTACEDRVPVCGEWELHTHTNDCFKDGVWVCGKLQVEEHVHGKKCFGLISSITRDSLGSGKKANKKGKQPKQIKQVRYLSNDGKNNYEVVKTGEEACMMLLFIGLAMIAGSLYFILESARGRKSVK